VAYCSKNFLGKDAPNDTLLMTQDAFDKRQKMLEKYHDAAQLKMAVSKLSLEKLDSEIEDSKWSQWYDHFHRIVLTQSDYRDPVFHVRTGLHFNMQATGLTLLIGVMVVPGLRRWWVVLPACGWVLLGVAEIISTLQKLDNKWLTLFEQINYLSKAAYSTEVTGKRSASMS
jgi:hypothetical protein